MLSPPESVSPAFGDRRERAVVGSALWAAAGDALGWISELTDQPGLQHRIYGAASISEPVAWRRRIGGRFGIVLDLPAGTYSDDTQLRLAVGRAIRGSGEFDVEAFAKIELPLWPAYSLGAGRSTSAAASNLSKSNVSWFANFFGRKGAPSYFDAGGNGAAMRIQPHVWRASAGRTDALLRDVLRDALVTHGHPVGFCGAAFHAFCLEHALRHGDVPGPSDWTNLIQHLRHIPDALASDQEVKLLWLPTWEETNKNSISSAVEILIEGTLKRLSKLEDFLETHVDFAYQMALELFGATVPETRGSGLGTAIVAAVLAWLHRSTSNEAALIQAASVLSSDTDTIGTMAGAILGAARPQAMNWPLQDRVYIIQEARRLAGIGEGRSGATFAYPDVMTWEPPPSQLDAVAISHGNLVLRGFGPIEPLGEVWPAGDHVWQWVKLEFGQTVLLKRRSVPKETKGETLPDRRRDRLTDKGSLSLFDQPRARAPQSEDPHRSGPETPTELVQARPVAGEPYASEPLTRMDVDELSDWVIRNEFRTSAIGEALTELSRRERSVEQAIAFSAIITKALVARRRRGATKR
jgi:ADP-ribosylglycohydrolase